MGKTRAIGKDTVGEAPNTFPKKKTPDDPELWCTFQKITDQRRAEIRAKILSSISEPAKDLDYQQTLNTQRYSKNIMVGAQTFRFDLAHDRKLVPALSVESASVLDFHPPEAIPVDGNQQRFQVWGPQGLQWLKDIVSEQNKTLAGPQKIKVIVLDSGNIPPAIWATKLQRAGKFSKTEIREHAKKLGFVPMPEYEFAHMSPRGRFSRRVMQFGQGAQHARDKLRETLRMGLKMLENERLEGPDSDAGTEFDSDLVALADKKDALRPFAPSSNDMFEVDRDHRGAPSKIRKITTFHAKRCRKRCPWPVNRVELKTTSDWYPVKDVVDKGFEGELIGHEWWVCPIEDDEDLTEA